MENMPGRFVKQHKADQAHFMQAGYYGFEGSRTHFAASSAG